MINLFDMMLKAQQGEAMRNMARQFGLTPEQVETAVSAMLPAFARGFERRTAQNNPFTSLLESMSKGPFGSFYDDAANAFGVQARDKGNDILGEIFGSKEVSRALAAQVEMLTGISQQVVKQMMPMMASIMAGGIAKETQAPSWQDQLDAVMSQMTGMMMPGAAQPPREPDLANKALQQWGRFFDVGIEAQRAQLKSFDDMLDQVFGPETRPEKNKDV